MALPAIMAGIGAASSILGSRGGSGAPASGAWQGVTGIGYDFSRYLREAIAGRLGETERFGNIAEVLRDKTDTMARTARARAGERAQDRGFYDSGQLDDMFASIDRGAIEDYTQNITQLLYGLEEQGLNNVLGFLQGASNEALGRAGVQSENRGNTLNFGASMFNSLSNMNFDGGTPPKGP